MSHPRMEPRAPWCSQPHLGAVSALTQWQVCLILCSVTPLFPHVLQHFRRLARVSHPNSGLTWTYLGGKKQHARKTYLKHCETVVLLKTTEEFKKIPEQSRLRAGGYSERLFLPLTQLSQHPTLLPSTFLNFLDFLLVALRESILGVGFWLASRWASTSRFLSLGFAFSAKLRVH